MRTLATALGIVLVVTVAPACASDDVGVRPQAAPTSASPSSPTTASSSASSSESSSPDASPTARAAASRKRPQLRVRRLVTGLDNPWDVKRLPGGTLLVSERDRARLSAYSDGERRTVRFPSDKIWVSGETGLMSLEVDPDFADNRRVYTCSGWQKKRGGQDIRVTAWRLDDGVTRAKRVDTVVTGLPTTSGRHGGCRLLIARNGAMYVGTGDAAVGTNPRDLTSLGGKVLRVDPATGDPWEGNPFENAQNKKKRLVLTYGHRNVQGLAQRADGSVWSVEHGSYRDDEVNRLKPGGDYGWHPVGEGVYDESVPMTDQSLPGTQVGARWSSGDPTIATSGAAWVRGKKWGKLDGTLAVAALKASRVVFMKFDARGRLKWTRSPEKLQQLGRLRSVTLTPDKSLLITTDNDGGTDAVLRVSPR